MGAADVVYSADRIRRLRLVLLVVVVATVLLGLLGVAILVGGDPDLRFAGGFGVVSAVLLLVAAGVTLRALPSGTRAAKRYAFGTGALLSLIGVLLVTTLVGWLFILLSIAVLLLAHLPDEPDGAAR